MNSSQRHLVLWDGDCAFCRRSVELAGRLDKKQQFDFCSYQSAPTPPMTPQLKTACADAVHVVLKNGRILRAGRAVLFILETTVQSRLLRRLLRIASHFPLITFVEIGYAIVARNRPFFSRFF